MEQLSHNHTDNSDELLSAYIDNAVDAGERRRAEQYIAACAACAQEVQELRMFRALLRDLPNVQPRRSFTLDPATVAPQRRLLFPTLRWSSLVAALLFVVVLGVDVLGGSAPGAPTAAPGVASSAKSGTQFDSAGGSAESMGSPQESPPAPLGADPANPESMPLTAQAPAASAAASPEVAMAEASPAASPAASASPEAAVAEASPAASDYAPPAAAASPAASAAPSPAMARNSQTTAALADPAGGNSAQLPQSQFQADEPAADTIQLAPDARAQGSWWSSYGLRFAEVALGLIALVLAGAALWTWRRQL